MEALRSAVRWLVMLWRPRLTGWIVAVLALGFGALVPVVAVVHHVYWWPSVFPHPETLVSVWDRALEPARALTKAEYDAWRPELRGLTGLATYRPAGSFLRLGEHTVREQGLEVSEAFFSVLGVAPAEGQVLDGPLPTALRTVVLTDAAWRRLGKPAIDGATRLDIDGNPHRLVGRMPEGFVFPDASTGYYVRLEDESRPGTSSSWTQPVIARTRRGVSHEAIVTEGHAAVRAHPRGSTAETRLAVARLDDVSREGVTPVVIVILIASGMTLLVALLNAAALAAARQAPLMSATRVRVVLGAQARRLALDNGLQMLALGLAAGVIGLCLGGAALLVLRYQAGPASAAAMQTNFPGSLAWLVLGATAVAGLLVGLPGALRVARLDASGLSLRQQSDRAYTPGRPGRRWGPSFLIGGQLALTFAVSLIALWLLGRFSALVAVNRGFEPAGLVVAQVELPEYAFPEFESRRLFFDTFLSSLAARLPDAHVGLVNTLPIQGQAYMMTRFWVDGDVGEQAPDVHVRIVCGEFAPALGLRVRAGRFLNGNDHAGNPKALVLNVAAWHLFGQQRLDHLALADGRQVWNVVGVVENVSANGIDRSVPPEGYNTCAQTDHWAYSTFFRSFAFRTMAVAIRTPRPPDTVVAVVRQTAATTHSSAAVVSGGGFQEILAQSRSDARVVTAAVLCLAVMCLALTAGGIYGLQWQAVHVRRRALAIHIACGAQPTDILKDTARRLALVLAAGVLGGAGLTWALSRLISTAVVAAADPRLGEFRAPAATAGFILLLTVALASYRSTRDAIHTDAARVLAEG